MKLDLMREPIHIASKDGEIDDSVQSIPPEGFMKHVYSIFPLLVPCPKQEEVSTMRQYEQYERLLTKLDELEKELAFEIFGEPAVMNPIDVATKGRRKAPRAVPAFRPTAGKKRKTPVKAKKGEETSKFKARKDGKGNDGV
ncbi:hypothetical protein BGX31_002174 [Mortierella sp. GBA43]|nr:hypothetical protein BGX31_002174 [Mortierella sp. GBA43]